MSENSEIVDGVDIEDPGFEGGADTSDDGTILYDDTPNDEQEIEQQMSVDTGAESEDGESETEFPEELIRAAGFASEDQARQYFQTPSELANAVRLMDRRHIETAQHVVQQDEDEEEEAAAQIEDVDLEKELEGFDEDTRNLITKLSKKHEIELSRRDQEMKRQTQAIEQLIQSQQQQSQQSAIHEFDEFVNSLDKWSHVFGRGTIETLSPQTIQFQNRAHLERTANLLQQGRVQSGQAPLPKDELYVRSLYAAFPEEHASILQREVEQRVAERQSMHTSRPVGRASGAQKTSLDTALDNVDNWFRERGIPLSSTDDEDYSVI